MLFNTHDLKGMNPEVKASLDRLIQQQLGEVPDVALQSLLPAHSYQLPAKNGPIFYEIPQLLGASHLIVSRPSLSSFTSLRRWFFLGTAANGTTHVNTPGTDFCCGRGSQ